MITKPKLPPMAGYVEVIDENGNHIYKPTAEMQAKLDKEETEATILADFDAMIVDYEMRLTMLELGI